MKETKRDRFIQAWKTVFDVEEVKDDDNFFEMGGDSMKGIQLISALAGYGLKLDMLKLYTQPTIEELLEAAEEIEPVEIPADVISGNLTAEEIEEYLKDPAIQKAMSEFGIRAEDIVKKTGAETKKTESKGSETVPGAEAGTGPDGIPPYMAWQPGAVPPYMAWQPGAIPMQAGYLIPVPVMYYFVPVSGTEGMPSQSPEAAPFRGTVPFQGACPISGAVPFPVMAYPVFMPWPYGTGCNPKNTPSEENLG